MEKNSAANFALAACVLGFIVPVAVYVAADALSEVSSHRISQWSFMLFFAFQLATIVLGIAGWGHRNGKIALVVSFVVVVLLTAFSLIQVSAPDDMGSKPMISKQSVGVTRSMESVMIEEIYTGVVDIPYDPMGNKEQERAPMVIRDQQSYEQFIALIPKNRITKRNPAPPSDDPLLQKPVIDFTQKMMLVVFRTGTISVPPEITSVAIKKESTFSPQNPEGDSKTTIVVAFMNPSLGDSHIESRPYGVGCYCAVLVAKKDGEVQFKKSE